MYRIKYLKYKQKYLELKNGKYLELKNLVGGYGKNTCNEYYSDKPLDHFNDFELKTYQLNNDCIHYFNTQQAVKLGKYDFDNTINDIKDNVAYINYQQIDNYPIDGLIYEALIELDQNRVKFINDILTTNNIPKDDIYTICAHGCTTEETFNVPKNCQYVTLGICSNTVEFNTAYYNIIEQFLNYKYIFENPRDNIFQLRELLGTDINIHYHDPNEKNDKGYNTYKNSFYTIMIEHENKIKNKKYFNAHTSGLMIAGSYNVKNNFFNFQKELKPCSSDPILNETNIKNIYKYSCFPTINNIIENLHPKTYYRAGDIFSIDQKTLFELLPGTYYNFVCRSPCAPDNIPLQDIIELRRVKSVEGSTIVMQQYKTTNLHVLCQNPNSKLSDISDLNIISTNINIRDENGKTPLFYLVENNSIDNIKFLLTFNPELNYKDINGNTILHLSIMYKFYEITKLLLDKENINVNRVNNEFNTPLHLICIDKIQNEFEKCENGQIIIKLLEMKDIKKSINIQNKENNTPAHLAFYYENNIGFDRLVKHKDINLDLENNEEIIIRNLLTIYFS